MYHVRWTLPSVVRSSPLIVFSSPALLQDVGTSIFFSNWDLLNKFNIIRKRKNCVLKMTYLDRICIVNIGSYNVSNINLYAVDDVRRMIGAVKKNCDRLCLTCMYSSRSSANY